MRTRRKPERPTRIAVNTMRSRLTILGFNLAIITFQITHLSGQRTDEVIQGIESSLHLPATLALYFALLLSIAAMVLLIASGSLSEDGACDSPALIVGDLLMYLGLAYTLIGFFQPLMTEFNTWQFPAARETAEFRAILHGVSICTVVAWVLAAYVGPVVSLLRSPYSRAQNILMGLSYIALMMVLAYFFGLASELQSVLDGRVTNDWPVVRLLFAPIDWLGSVGVSVPRIDG